jgi:hypothetical protein
MSATLYDLPISEQESLVERIAQACNARGIATTNVLAITMQENRSSNFSSLIIDFESRRILANYPIAAPLSVYREITVGNLLVCYSANLDTVGIVDGASSSSSSSSSVSAFCCSRLTPYRPRTTSSDHYFADFFAGRGSHPDVVFEVKEQVDNGPLLSTRYWKLADGSRQQVQGPFSSKRHVYKNMKCSTHNRFYAIDLYNASNASSWNAHHMRIVPFTKVVQSVIDQFLQ